MLLMSVIDTAKTRCQSVIVSAQKETISRRVPTKDIQNKINCYRISCVTL